MRGAIRWGSGFLASVLVERAAHLDPLSTYWAGALATKLLTSAATAPLLAAAPVVAIERLRGLAPVRRSARLLLPLYRAAFGLMAVYALVFLALDMSFGLAAAAVAHAPLGDAYAGGNNTLLGSTMWRATWVIEALLLFATAPFGMVAQVSIYLRAREAEGDPVVAGLDPEPVTPSPPFNFSPEAGETP